MAWTGGPSPVVVLLQHLSFLIIVLIPESMAGMRTIFQKCEFRLKNHENFSKKYFLENQRFTLSVAVFCGGGVKIAMLSFLEGIGY